MRRYRRVSGFVAPVDRTQWHEQQDLVEETGVVATEPGGRPAKLLHFRRIVLTDRAVTGGRLPLAPAI